MIIVTQHICIFIDCTYIEVVTEHCIEVEFIWTVLVVTGRMYIFLKFSGIETATGRMGLCLY